MPKKITAFNGMDQPYGWTGRQPAYTKDTKQLHAEVAKETVTRWTPRQIAKAQASGYFDDLTRRCQARKKELYGPTIGPDDDDQ